MDVTGFWGRGGPLACPLASTRGVAYCAYIEVWLGAALGAALGDGVGIVGFDIGGPPESSRDEFCKIGVGRWAFIDAEAVGLVCVAVGWAAWGIGIAGLVAL